MEPLAESRALDLQVRADEIQLVVQHRPLAFGAAQGVAEDVGELLDRAIGDGRVAMDQAGDRIERVEEKVRVDLRPQRLHLGTARVERQLLRALLLFELAFLQMKVVEHVREHVARATSAARGPR